MCCCWAMIDRRVSGTEQERSAVAEESLVPVLSEPFAGAASPPYILVGVLSARRHRGAAAYEHCPPGGCLRLWRGGRACDLCVSVLSMALSQPGPSWTCSPGPFRNFDLVSPRTSLSGGSVSGEQVGRWRAARCRHRVAGPTLAANPVA